ncbi:M1 family metallopeptidase [Streptococcus mutans]|uniref:M1 family metallopeptidase n=1 Tax=Streptococcus mutans TaxID=1309 RepID=UPI0002B52130|nr:M1 family metallopeptidase [Streptococcus mutans]EMC13654.1 aminopeptidase N [Streptococcus mutans M2A]EMC46773.1 aminopeptidase N [Streptococcus mutans 24]EMP62564.1 aminopeptidase N [Streptococcus mutans KK23]MDT9486743.1 M1 family metallopeptidase [Streptococcus mutans]MDT9537755.1 M1 family metallopeptidase [Streptococcus mutans]
METVEHLIEKFVPENYNIFLDINRQEKFFSGNVAINGEALDNVISFHQKDLTIHSVLLDNNELTYHIDNENEAVRIELPETGSMTLVLEFSGKITDNMTGIYPSYYTVENVKKEIISTQFESHFAREVFPSIDEPEAKATFDLALKFDQEEGDIALSNMPEINANRRQETGVWTFETTPRMSSYLLAFALGNLHGKTAYTKGGTEVGVFATCAHNIDSVDFALDIAVHVIDFYEDYYGIKYPIAQAYHVALPDFSAGAMENWGLITYREVYLLVDENSTVSSRQQVALVVAHELAHQWFGNLVTMKWWDDLWLNESFANMMEYVAIDAIEPNWHIFEDFQTSGVPHALKRDATDSVQSVHVAVNHPDEINTLFDAAIVYAKGSRLMHMLRRWLGDKVFAAGLKLYFEKHQYNNTVGRDLWNALSTASGKDVASFMDAWLEQPGYPLVTLKLEGDSLQLSQKQFFIGEYEDQDRLWPIPLNSNWSGLPEILSEKTIEIPNFSQLAAVNKEKGPLRLNTDNTAHYISNYEGQLLKSILSDFENLDKTSKLQIIQERRLLAESGQISYAELVKLLTQLSHETSYMVASASDQLIAGLKRFLDEDSQSESMFKVLVRDVYRTNYQRLGFEKSVEEMDEDEKVRQITISNMIYADDPDANEKAQAIFANYKENIEAIPAAIRLDVLTNQIKHAETDDLVSLYLDSYVKTNDSNFRRQLASALANTKSQITLDRILAQLPNRDVIKPQDLSLWYGLFLRKSFAQETFWAWARENWAWIKATLGGDMSFDSFVIIPANVFKTPERLAEYKAFFEPQLDDLSISRNITMGIKEIAARITLIEKEKAAVEQTIVNTFL